VHFLIDRFEQTPKQNKTLFGPTDPHSAFDISDYQFLLPGVIPAQGSYNATFESAPDLFNHSFVLLQTEVNEESVTLTCIGCSPKLALVNNRAQLEDVIYISCQGIKQEKLRQIFDP
jgi:hypothetical protein